MNLESVNQMLEQSTGDYSIFYPLLKDRLKEYTEEELPFREEFLFFEERYLLIRKHMEENSILGGQLVDVGCQYGFQSEIFPDWKYMGIDRSECRFFNQEKPNVRYAVGYFPSQIHPDLSNAVVMSIMSLGYFKDPAYKPLSEEWANMDLAVLLSKAKHLYVVTTPGLIRELSKLYKHRVRLQMCRLENINGKHSDFSLWYMTNQSSEMGALV